MLDHGEPTPNPRLSSKEMNNSKTDIRSLGKTNNNPNHLQILYYTIEAKSQVTNI